MREIKALCMSYMMGHTDQDTFLIKLIKELLTNADKPGFISKIAQQLYYTEPEEGDGW